MVKEKVVNIFLIINKDNVESLKAKCHEVEGSDEKKIRFLQDLVEEDLKTAEVFELPVKYMKVNVENYKKIGKEGGLKSVPYDYFNLFNVDDQFFEEIYTKYDLPISPLRIITPVVDGEIKK